MPMVESKHLAVELLFITEGKDSNSLSNTKELKPFSFSKYTWVDSDSSVYLEKFNSSLATCTINRAINFIDVDVNLALSEFNTCFEYAGEIMKKKINVGKPVSKIWFDLECKQSRTVLRKHLRKYRKTHDVEDRFLYAQKRREYKELLKQKKQSYKESIVDKLNMNINDPKLFWNTLRSVRPRKSSNSSITAQEWYQHFKSVFNELPGSSDVDLEEDVQESEADCTMLNQPISENEIKTAISALKLRKAAGPDGIIGEFYRYSINNILPFLLPFFNYLFDHGLYPNEWCLSILQPLHKKGDLNVADNYRGISLLNICSKIYSSILNKRINNWIEENNIIGEEQAGFREDYSTVDHIFTMLAMVQKQLLRHRKLYAAFIDFRKAFDSVRREKLWIVLKKNGLKGKMYNALKSMYDTVLAQVRVNGDLTNMFSCPRGLKQGEVCSPILFSLFINELTKDITQEGRHGIQLSPDFVQLLILLFADDVVLFSDSIIGLQTQLNVLYRTATRLDLIVNLEKSNIVVFRNGGYLAQNEKWYFGNSSLTVLNQYKYLGIYLTTKITFTPTLQDLALRARKGLSAIFKLLWSLDNHSPEVFFKIFDCQIQPILTYGSEIWGLAQDQEIIERVHLSALKRFLGVNSKSPRHVIYGETGRYPLYVNTYARCLKFWLRLTSMDRNRLPNKAYRMLLFLQEQNYTNTWACKIRNVLFRFGFGIVWEAQSVGDIKRFITEFKLRLKDCFSQDWHNSLQNHEFYSLYSTYKQTLSLSPFLLSVKNIFIRKTLARFRIGMSPLRFHFLRYSSFNRRNIDCPFCIDCAETEIHFLLVCKKYSDLRYQFIPRKFYRCPSLFKFTLLLACKNDKTTNDLACFIYKALQVRQACMNVL